MGHIIYAEGVATDPTKLETITKWQAPTTVKKLRGFLGLTGCYRRFIKDYSNICQPLYAALRKDNFQWGPQQQQAFDTLKKVMTTPPMLSLPNFSQPFVLETDSCQNGIGAVLMQNNKPLAYFSKCLGPRAQAQSIYEKEALAILWALKKWRHYFLAVQ